MRLKYANKSEGKTLTFKQNGPDLLYPVCFVNINQANL